MSAEPALTIPGIDLHDGGSIPLVGTGTLFAKGRELADLLAQVIADGYRLIDTAAQYANETAVGAGIARSGVDRAELFVTTKVAGGDQGRGHTRAGLERSLERLGTDHVDLLLIHWPNPSRGLAVQTWLEMLELQAEGLVRHLGVSNFAPDQLTELHHASGVWPVVDQIQLNPTLHRREWRDFLARHSIVAEAWSPMGRGQQLLSQIPLQRLAEQLGVSPAQVALRWAVQQGIVVIPASGTPEHWRGNADIFGFTLDDEQLRDLAALDLGEGHAADPHVHEEW